MGMASKAAAKAAGKTKRATQALAGYAEIFNHLAEEHSEVSMMMKRVAQSSNGSSVRENLFPEIRKNLLAHAHAEEETFYPPLRKFSDLKELVGKCLEEHKQVEQYLEQLESGNKDTKTWHELFERMMRAVEKHVDREENELFPQANELLSEGQADEVEERYEAAEEREKAQL